jgi:hypothetical protein
MGRKVEVKKNNIKMNCNFLLIPRPPFSYVQLIGEGEMELKINLFPLFVPLIFGEGARG